MWCGSELSKRSKADQGVMLCPQRALSGGATNLRGQVDLSCSAHSWDTYRYIVETWWNMYKYEPTPTLPHTPSLAANSLPIRPRLNPKTQDEVRP
jgi:hypothetical protein